MSETSRAFMDRGAMAARLLLVTFGGALIISYLFITVSLKEIAAFYISDTLMGIGPLVVGFFMGLLLSKYEMPIIVLASTLTTAFSALLVSMTYLSPQIMGVAEILSYYYQLVFQEISLCIILTYPTTLVSSVLGKMAGENALDTDEKRERDRLRLDTLEWYRMLETVETDKLKGKGAPKAETPQASETIEDGKAPPPR